jgi:hypothetical protein
MHRAARLISIVVAGLVLASAPAAPQSVTDFACPVTMPNGIGLGHGTDQLSTYLMSSLTFKLGGVGEVLRDGWLRWPKWPWRRGAGARGPLTVRGRRIDAPADAMRVQLCNECYGDVGFIPMSMDFPSPGCWEITGRVGDHTLTFVISVIKIGSGPNRRLLI